MNFGFWPKLGQILVDKSLILCYNLAKFKVVFT
jgi:hypothetical protein